MNYFDLTSLVQFNLKACIEYFLYGWLILSKKHGQRYLIALPSHVMAIIIVAHDYLIGFGCAQLPSFGDQN